MAMVSIDARQVGKIARGIRQASPVAWKACRARLVAVGNEVADDMRARASYSTRIPGSIKVRPTAAGNIRISYGGDQAPDAVPIENKGRGGIRHPVYGHRDRWTSKNSPPAFALPAFAARREWALAEMEKAYMDAFIAAFERGV